MTGVLQGFAEGNGVVRVPDQRINSAPVDRFTLIHILMGGLSSAIGFPLPVVVVFAAWFEIAENVFQGGFPSIFPNTAPNDSIANAVCDVAASTAAWTAVDLLKRW